MLFNSFQFLLVFLPVTLAGYFLLGRKHHQTALAWLGLASLAFYAWWDPANLPILLVTILWNYLFGTRIHSAANPRTRSALLFLGVAGNLLALGFYKYAAFLTSALNDALSLGLPVPSIILPLGISFFTFTQIAFLVDAYARKVSDVRKPISYVLFVSYFPHLIAGPIIHHKDVMTQFEQRRVSRFSWKYISIGFTIFTIGLMKKVLLADPISGSANAAFEISKTSLLTFTEAWFAALAYTMQLYFDFSGYSDMAVGLSLMLGIWLPFNFNSPYKSCNIIDFWRRWHITLSRFLRDYLYIPLGGNRKGKYRKYINLLLTMALGGLWHGANWTFLLWGTIHGLLLTINHAFRYFLKRRKIVLKHPLWRFAFWGITFICIIFAWVLFRAESLDQALRIWYAMLQFHQLFTGGQLVHFSAGSGWSARSYTLIPILTLLALLTPNTQTILRRFRQETRASDEEIPGESCVTWLPSKCWALVVALGFILGILSLYNVSEFLYFNF
jgi:alginate O-acetyltransferase complex protein AlgI